MMTKKLILATAIATLATPLMANEVDVYLNAGRMGFSDVDLKDSNAWGIGLGYAITDKWTLETVMTQFDSENYDSIPVDIDGAHYRLDALYHLETSNEWRPFLAFGLGDQKLDVNAFDASVHHDTLINFGVGLKRNLTTNWEFRGDMRNFTSLDDEYNELALMLGVGYRFGVANKSAPKPVVAPTPVAVEVDSDGDGVFDSKDQCADTPKTHKVDAVGCSLKLTKTVEVELKITFDSAKSIIKPEFESEVAKLAEFMNQYAETVVTIEGHTDNQGAEAFNQKLSQSRADAVKAMLVTKYGVALDRVTAIGYGKAKPIADNSTPEGREQNRRVVGEVSTATTQTEIRE